MAVTIALRFPWGRFHATPWERSANEAEPEWPPSPWRLLRALYSVWRFRCPTLDAAVVQRLLEQLVGPPAYSLPAHEVAHTRHYFPDHTHRNGQSGATDKVFDAFVVIPADEPVLLRWSDVALEPPEATALATLLAELPFLGRAESICEASVVANAAAGTSWVEPSPPGASLHGRREVGVLAAAAPLNLDCLLSTTADVRRKGFVDPPGSCRVRYGLPPRETAAHAPRRHPRPRPTVAVLAVHGNVLPHVTATLAMCELLRLSVQSKFGDICERASSTTLSGKLQDGEKRLDQHAHAHYLALPGGDGRSIRRFVIWAPEGLAEEEVRAVTALRVLDPGRRALVDGGKGLRRVDVRLEALGDTHVLGDELIGPVREWRSTTPFLTTRNLNNATRRRLVDADDPWLAFLAEEVQREAGLRGLGTVDVRPRPAGDGPSWLAFRRHRAFKSEKLASTRRGGGFDLRFPEPVSGPIALGANSHFGLGLFLPVHPS